MPPASQPTPERVFETLTAYQTSAALAAAIELDLFTAIAAGADSLAALAERSGASERGLRALANHLVVRGFLAKKDERYRLTEESALFLDRRSPQFMGSASTFLTSEGLQRCFERLADAVRRGGTVAPAGGTVAAENPVWVDFARSMEPLARPLSVWVADLLCRPEAPRRVLDIAAGHGLYGIELAKRSPATEVVAVDWGNVLAVAEANARTSGVERRFRKLPGNAFELDWGRDFDLVLLTNFLHHFPREECVRLLGKARAALRSSGRVAALESIVADNRVSPPRPAALDLVMLATTPGGESYTLREYEEQFRAAGLARPERHDLAPVEHSLLVAGASGKPN